MADDPTSKWILPRKESEAPRKTQGLFQRLWYGPPREKTPPREETPPPALAPPPVRIDLEDERLASQRRIAELERLLRAEKERQAEIERGKAEKERQREAEIDQSKADEERKRKARERGRRYREKKRKEREAQKVAPPPPKKKPVRRVFRAADLSDTTSSEEERKERVKRRKEKAIEISDVGEEEKKPPEPIVPEPIRVESSELSDLTSEEEKPPKPVKVVKAPEPEPEVDEATQKKVATVIMQRWRHKTPNFDATWSYKKIKDWELRRLRSRINEVRGRKFTVDSPDELKNIMEDVMESPFYDEVPEKDQKLFEKKIKRLMEKLEKKAKPKRKQAMADDAQRRRIKAFRARERAELPLVLKKYTEWNPAPKIEGSFEDETEESFAEFLEMKRKLERNVDALTEEQRDFIPMLTTRGMRRAYNVRGDLSAKQRKIVMDYMKDLVRKKEARGTPLTLEELDIKFARAIEGPKFGPGESAALYS